MKQKKYKIRIMLLIICFFCSFAFGCNTGVIFKGAITKKTSQEYYLKFEYMDGIDSHVLSLKSDDVLDVHFKKEEGIFSVLIGIEGEDYIYKTDDGGNMDFKLNIKKEGEYKITICSKKAKGMIEIKVSNS